MRGRIGDTVKIIGIDIGTTSISMVLTDGKTRELFASRTINHQSFLPEREPGEKIQDPEKIWQLVKEMLADLICQQGRPEGLGLTGQMHGILYVDDKGEAVTPLYTWQDERGQKPLEAGKSSVDILKEATGSAASGYGLVTHLYLQKTGRIPKQAKTMAGISDYVAMKLCGLAEPVIGRDMAASWGGFGLQEGEFCKEKLVQAGVDLSYLPRVEKEHFFVGETREGIPVMGAIGDNQASFLGAVEDLDDTVLINVGTGSQISFVSKDYVEGDGRIELRPCGKGGYLLAGSSLCGGRAYALLEQFYREVTGNLEESCYERMYRDAERFLKEQGMEQVWKVQTTFSGTRKAPEQTGEIKGITAANFHPGAMTLGVIRGILEELYQQYESMCRLTGRKAGRLVGSGNGLRKNPLMQKMAEELFRLKLEIPKHQEEAACGAAFCAGKLL